MSEGSVTVQQLPPLHAEAVYSVNSLSEIHHHEVLPECLAARAHD